MPKLFISHASEDKDAFVRPLAEALVAADFEVWYDEYQLTLGDSLREKIDEGLQTCDYGIVVLSNAFFAKEWPKRELDGLLAREKAGNKRILPLWHGVTRESVEKFSLILAGRLGGHTGRGITHVVEEIRRATAYTIGTVEYEKKPNADARLSAAQHPPYSETEESRRLSAADAEERLRLSFIEMRTAIGSMLVELQSSGGASDYFIYFPSDDIFAINASTNLNVSVKFTKPTNNFAGSATLTISYRRAPSDFNRKPKRIYEDVVFSPRMLNEDVVEWTADGSRLMTAGQLAGHILEQTASKIARAHD